MSRRILSTVVATLMLFALLPATAAFAQANASASLASGDRVRFPGEHTYTVTVTNNEPPLIGRTINAVQIYLPVIGSGVVFNGAPPAAGGFTGTPTNLGSTQFITYRGGSIAPGASQAFSIPATVLRPYRADLASDFIAKVSSNNFTSSVNAQPASANALTAAVEVLEILPGTLQPVAPTNADNSKGVTDGSGTAGQTVTYAFDVKNHAREALDVTGSLEANNSVDSPGAGVTQSIPGEDGQGSVTVPVTLGPSPTGDRSVTFTASATAPNADAAGQNDTFTVQRPVDIAFTGLNPTRVKSGFGSAREFNVTAAKVGGAGFDLTEGALTFGSNEAGLVGEPVRFEAGNRTTNLRYQIAEIDGADNDYTATITSIGGDDNLANYNLNFDAGIITIDNIIPTLELDLPVLGDEGNDVDGDELIAATNGTEITVSGKALGTDLDADTLEVVLQPDVGDAIPVSVSQTQESDGISFTGSTEGDWDDNATRFVAVAQIADEAGNSGVGQSSFTIVDTALPVLDLDSGVILSPTTIRVQFDDATGLRGGCDPSSWRIDGTPGRVADVHTSAGESCTDNEELARALSTDGVRVLVLNYELGWDDTPPVTYDDGLSAAVSRQLGVYLAKDGAQNDALEQTISTVTDLVPPAPNVDDVRRPDHESGELEPATFDAEEGRYYTNVGGTEAITATITGVRENYTIQVLDGSNRVIHEEEGADKPLLDPLATEWTQEITIPLGTSDGQHVRGVRLVSAVGNASPATLVNFVLDTSLPTIGESVQTGPSEGLGYFNEKIVNGSEKSVNWFVTWIMEGQNGPESASSQVQTVERIDATTRRINWDFEVQTFQRLDYLLLEETRYEDRAGNYMLDTLQPQPMS